MPNASPLVNLYGRFVLKFSNLIIYLSQTYTPLHLVAFLWLCMVLLYVIGRSGRGDGIEEEMRKLEKMVEEVRQFRVQGAKAMSLSRHPGMFYFGTKSCLTNDFLIPLPLPSSPTLNEKARQGPERGKLRKIGRSFRSREEEGG